MILDGLPVLIFVLRMILDLKPCPMPRKPDMKVKHNYFFSATLAQTFSHRCSALTGAAITVLALAEPFIAAGAAVAFWFFFATEKELGPRGYERNEIIKCLVGNTKHKNICFCLWQRIFDTFFLMKKYPKHK